MFDRLTYLRNLEKRKEEVKLAIAEQGKLIAELEKDLSQRRRWRMWRIFTVPTSKSGGRGRVP